MKPADIIDRRQHTRVSLTLEMEVSLLSDKRNAKSDISSQQCRGRDISGGGVSFFTATQFLPEDLLRIRIAFAQQPSLNGSDKLLKVMGKVMWCKRSEEHNSYITGVEFLNIYENDFKYLEEYVRKHVGE